jgi:hypothetical protein
VTERRLFLNDCQVDASFDGRGKFARIVHLPTGITAEGEWGAAVAAVARKLIERGDISINDARAALGLPEWNEDFANGT